MLGTFVGAAYNILRLVRLTGAQRDHAAAPSILILTALATVFRPLFATPEKGAEPTIWLATSPTLEGVSGRYNQKKNDKRSSPKSYDEALAARLWDVSSDLAQLDE